MKNSRKIEIFNLCEKQIFENCNGKHRTLHSDLDLSAPVNISKIADILYFNKGVSRKECAETIGQFDQYYINIPPIEALNYVKRSIYELCVGLELKKEHSYQIITNLKVSALDNNIVVKIKGFSYAEYEIPISYMEESLSYSKPINPVSKERIIEIICYLVYRKGINNGVLCPVNCLNKVGIISDDECVAVTNLIKIHRPKDWGHYVWGIDVNERFRSLGEDYVELFYKYIILKAVLGQCNENRAFLKNKQTFYKGTTKNNNFMVKCNNEWQSLK